MATAVTTQAQAPHMTPVILAVTGEERRQGRAGETNRQSRGEVGVENAQ